jgi:heme A synthase
VQQGDQAGEDPTSENDTRPERSPVDRRFAAIIGALRAEDPRFARRVSEPHRLRTGHIMMLTGLVATVLLGVLPLAVGIQTQLAVLLTIGAIGIAFGPVIVPPLVGVVLHRARPAW